MSQQGTKPAPLSQRNPAETGADPQRDTRSKPAPVVRPVVWAWVLKPGPGPGYLTINDNLYQVVETQYEHDNGMADSLWDLRKPDGTTYRVCRDRDGDLACDCPDSVYRDHAHTCKHVRAIREAYADLERDHRLAAFIAARQTKPADYRDPADLDCF